MKTFLLSFVLSLFLINSQGQLLKRLKEKAAKALEPKKETASATSANEATTTATTENQGSTNTKAPATPPANGSLVFTLGADETLLYDESKIITKNNQLSYAFVVKNKAYEYFLIEDGKRSGPFKEPPLRSVKPGEEDDGGTGSDEASIGNDKKDPLALQYGKTIDGKLYLAFNGKNYGPYDFVSRMILSPDKKHFFALVTIGGENAMAAKMGIGNIFIVNDAGLKKPMGAGSMTAPFKFYISEGFTHAMATVMDQKTQKILTITSTGKQQEGSIADMASSGDGKTMVSNNGDIVSVPSQSPTQLLINGKEVAAFKVAIKSMDRLFILPDASKSVYYEKGKLYKADGSEESLTGVLFPKVASVGNETAVYYFKIFRNESGAKDVYLCKKVI